MAEQPTPPQTKIVKARPRPRRWSFVLAALLLASLFALAALELSLRLYYTLTFKDPAERTAGPTCTDPKRVIDVGALLQLDSDPNLLYRMRANLAGRFRDSLVQTNALGLRDDPIGAKTSHTLRLLALGDSSLFGWAVPGQASYIDLIEAELQRLAGPPWQVECINTGVPAYNTVQEVETFVRLQSTLRPDAVLIQFDVNDVIPNLIHVKPDYLFAPRLIVLHPQWIFSGAYAWPGAVDLLGEGELAFKQNQPISGWAAQAAALRRLASLCAQSRLPLLALTIFEDQPPVTLIDGPSPRHRQFATLCRELGIPLIDGRATANAHLLATGGKFSSLLLSTDDLHPTLAGHAYIAQAAAPAIAATLLRTAGLTSASLPNFPALGNLALREATRRGLHQPENWSGARINWTDKFGTFRFRAAGRRVAASYLVQHPDLSTTQPLRVTIRVDGVPASPTGEAYVLGEAAHTRKGMYSQELDLTPLAPGELTFSIEVSRTWQQAPDPRQLGVALQQLDFK